ncbi:MAG: hypothetical protein AAGA69_09875, partial [Pseudomonadota bacterium]
MVFGWRSAVLLLQIIPLMIVAVLLWTRSRETRASYFLIGLMAAWALLITPYVIGFMGAYDLYPWLTFAPFNTEVWFGGLVYLYALTLTQYGLPARWWLWLVPGAVQTSYYTLCFVLLGSGERKFAFNNAFHEPFIVPLETIASVGLAIAGVILSWRQVSRYRAWLSATHAGKERFDLTSLRVFLVIT